MSRIDELRLETADSDLRPRLGLGMVVARRSGVVVIDGVPERIREGITRIAKHHERLQLPGWPSCSDLRL